MNLQLIGHLGTLIISTGVIYLSLINLLNLRYKNISKQIKFWLRVFCLLIICQIGLFMYLEMQWLIDQHDLNVGATTSFLWLIFRYFTVLIGLSVGMAIRVYLSQQSQSDSR